MRQFIRSWNDSIKYLSDPAASDGIVFYSEGDAYAPFLQPLINALGDVYDGPVYYLTSDATDRILIDAPLNIRGFYISDGSARIYTLNHMHAAVVAMTTPDINTFHIKRSLKAQHYAYIHHSPVSTHMIYRKGAFDHFDSILCVGPHQMEETRVWETLQGLPAKQLFEHGYPFLDSLIEAAAKNPAPPIGSENRLNILLAPSWGPMGLMETCVEEVVRIILDAGHFVRLRPHPRTRQISGRVLDALAKNFSGHPRFDMNEDTTKFDALFLSHIMISDWSGVAMEFAFGLERPVLFVDVPRKINNPDYTTVPLTPLEISYREEVGRVIRPDRLDELPAMLASLHENIPDFKARIRRLRETKFYNIGVSGKRGAEILMGLVSQKAKES